MKISEIVIYFLIYSFLGWILESVYKTILEKKFINSGFLHSCFCPIYGLAALIMLIFLNEYKHNYVLLFVLAFVLLSAWEYVVGALLEKFFKTKYWDYSDKKINIKGRVCLDNSIAWAVLGFVFIKWLHPFIVSILEKLPTDETLLISIILFLGVSIDFIITVIKVCTININLKKLSEITERLKEEMENIKVYASKKTIKNPKVHKVVEELKQKQASIKETLYKQTARFRRAFPTMKSEKITKYLSDRIEAIKNIKNRR
ncbi:MAG: putative ABC transporter permease [Lachnospiraceae bacterium]|jgi:uncharacterized membrane protein|nr:putative ABC transporter permease [Lachnospiraceae bacterium]